MIVSCYILTRRKDYTADRDFIKSKDIIENNKLICIILLFVVPL
jgi:hypothetical protein